MDRVDVSILIVNWNTRELVCECLRSVYCQTSGLTFEVILVDNASQDGSCEKIKEAFGQVKLLRSEENLGFARGNNLAATSACGDYYLLLNPDTVVRKDAIKKLLAFAKACPDGGAWGGVCELPDGRVDPGCRQLAPTVYQRIQDLFGCASARVARLDRGESFEGKVPVLSGAYMMIRSDVWCEMEGFDETFTLYAEETDLCYRVRMAGYEVYMTGHSRILHNTGSGNPHDPKRMLYQTRGVMHFYRKHFTWCQATGVAVMIWLHSIERIIGAFVFMPLLGVSRYRSIRHRMSLVWRHPRTWWHGWQGQEL